MTGSKEKDIVILVADLSGYTALTEAHGNASAVDVYHLYKTLGIELNVFSSALKLNTQYMHCIWYDVKLDKKITKEKATQMFIDNPRVSVTYKKASNLVFSFGREHKFIYQIGIDIAGTNAVNLYSSICPFDCEAPSEMNDSRL